MRRFRCSRLNHLSVSEWLHERLLAISHNEWPTVEKVRHFSGIRGAFLRFLLFNSHRHLVFSASPIKSALEPSLFHFFFLRHSLLLQAFFLDLLFFPVFSNSSLSILSKMTKDGNDSDGLGDAHPALWDAKLTKADEPRIRLECFIPKFVKIRFDTEKKGVVVRSNYHEVCVYKTMFRATFRLPFLPMVQELLDNLDLAPH
jgi:hypothetical protein